MAAISPPSVLKGFHMPAEWEPHERTWMGWPDRPDNWREHAKLAQEAFASVIRAIAQFEPVTVCCNPTQLATATATLLPHPNIQVIELAQDDAWFRDTGPTFVVRRNHEPALGAVDWDFNAWGGVHGGLYPDWSHDKTVCRRLITHIPSVAHFPVPIVLEGGSIHVDGQGTLLTTEECLINPNRNPTLSKSDIERTLSTALGVSHFIWLPFGLVGDDDTNGHVDNIACFVKPGVVMLSWAEEGEDEEQYRRCMLALQVLESSVDAKGRKIQVIKLPLPRAMVATQEDVRTVQIVDGVKSREAGARLAASYANFYICNGAVIMPGFAPRTGGSRNEVVESDERAKAVVEAAFPDRMVVQVPTREVLLGGGNIHCITQQQPKVLL